MNKSITKATIQFKYDLISQLTFANVLQLTPPVTRGYYAPLNVIHAILNMK